MHFSKYAHIHRGITLVELLVATALFSFIMVIVGGIATNTTAANARLKGFRAALDNVSTGLEFATREIRSGKNFHCDSSVSPTDTPRDCVSPGATSFVFLDEDGDSVTYRYNASNKSIERETNGVIVPLTERTEFLVDNFSVTIKGASSMTDFVPTFITLVISGHTTDPRRPVYTVFQTSIAQRAR